MKFNLLEKMKPKCQTATAKYWTFKSRTTNPMARTASDARSLTINKHTLAGSWQQVPAKRISDRALHVLKGLMNPNMNTRKREVKED